MSLLPSVGSITYNGYTFNGSVKSSLTGRPVYDDAGRTVTHVVYTVAVDSYIPESAPGGGTGTQINAIRQQLSTPGQALQIDNTGLGTFDINVGGASDVVWGPKPTLVALYAIGSTACHRVIWNCEVAIPECSSARYNGVPMAFNYSTTYRIDADGLTHRTYSGYLEIPMTRVAGSRVVFDSAMNYKAYVNIPLLGGFKRTDRTFKLSEDKRRLDFTITDEELPSNEALPAGCTNANGQFSFRSTNYALVSYVISLSATYTVAPLAAGGRRVAWDAFYALLFDRLSAAVNTYGQINGGNGGNNGGVMMASFSAEEGLYMDNRTVSFEASWLVTNGSIADILIGSGMWRPVPGTNWQTWATSSGVAEAQSLGGDANLTQPSGEIIIDLCGGATAVPNDTGTTLTASPSLPNAPAINGAGWIDYQLKTENHVDPGTVAIKTLPASSMSTGTAGTGGMTTTLIGQTDAALPPSTAPVATPPAGGGTDDSSSPLPSGWDSAQPWPPTPAGAQEPGWPPPVILGNPSSGPSQTPTTAGDTWQQRVDPRMNIVLRSFGVRVGQRVLCPTIQSYNGNPVVPIRPQYFAQHVVGYLCGVPVFKGEWVLKYQVLAKRVS